MELKIGVLAIQGAFLEHKTCLLKVIKGLNSVQSSTQLTVEVIEVRKAEQIDGLDAMIIPGGESTTMGKSLKIDGFGDAIKTWMTTDKKPVVWGTCAGMILLANDLENTGQAHLGGLDVKVSRNFFGRQVNSFEANIEVNSNEVTNPGPENFDDRCHGVFIRAPAIIQCTSDKVKVIGTVAHPQNDAAPVIIAVRQENIIATAFHPELTDDIRWHKYFLDLVIKGKETIIS